MLAIEPGDLLWIFGGGAAVLLALLPLWSPLLNTTVNQELAQAEGVAVGAVQAVFMLLMALAVALGMKIVGILLIVSLLIIPAAAARQLARSPEQMALLAAAAGVLAVALGLAPRSPGTRRPAPRSWSRRRSCSSSASAGSALAPARRARSS